MRIVLNGEAYEFSPAGSPASGAATVASLTAALDLDPRKVAVERNLAIVPKSAYAATAIEEGDRIEIVTFVGGG
ncbi:MAG: sulfur carrier protein ThiS [Parvularculaceae bacterium]